VATPRLETARLVLEPIAIADAPAIQRLFPRWEIVRYLASVVPWPYPPDGADFYIRNVALPAIERGDEWIWTIRLNESPDQIIGSVGLKRHDEENRGFWLGLEYHGRGIMTEASAAATDFWFDVLKFPVLRVPKAAANVASRRISERQGMRLIARIERDYVGGRMPADLWEITAEEWRAQKSARGRHEPADRRDP
jgi:ribosomal-protein-alanine N-acetyltransferase